MENNIKKKFLLAKLCPVGCGNIPVLDPDFYTKLVLDCTSGLWNLGLIEDNWQISLHNWTQIFFNL